MSINEIGPDFGRIFDKRKVSKTFRFKPETVAKLKNLKEQSGQSETEIMEKLIIAAKTR